LLTTGSTTLVFIEMNSKKPCPAPAPFMEKIRKFF
jgi:acyl-CoA thioesterase FadM